MATPLEKAVYDNLRRVGQTLSQDGNLHPDQVTNMNTRLTFVNTCIEASKQWPALGVVLDIDDDLDYGQETQKELDAEGDISIPDYF